MCVCVCVCVCILQSNCSGFFVIFIYMELLQRKVRKNRQTIHVNTFLASSISELKHLFCGCGIAICFAFVFFAKAGYPHGYGLPQLCDTY